MSHWDRYARMGSSRAALLCLIALALCVWAGWSLPRLHIDTRLQALLPEGTPTQEALSAMRERVDADTPFNVLITSDDPALNRSLALQLAQELESWEETRWATARRDVSELRQAAALYLDTATLKHVSDDMQAMVDWQACAHLPGCENLSDKPELPTRNELARTLSRSPTGRTLGIYLGPELGRTLYPGKSRGKKRAKTPPAGQDPTLLCASHGRVCAVQAALLGDAEDATFSQHVLDKADALFRRLRPDDAPDSLRMLVSGRVRNAPLEHATIESDLARTAWMSCALILTLLALQFRGLRALVLLMAPLTVALLTTLGLLAWIHPRLNLISAFTLAILGGVGVDFGIHLLTQYGEQRERGYPCPEALARTLRAMFGSLLAAAVTTGCAFAALSASKFRGIAEMGWMAGLGVLLSLVAFLLLLPPLTLLMHRLTPMRRSLHRGSWLRAVPMPSRGLARGVVLLGTLLALAGAFSLKHLKTETDFRKLRMANASLGIPTREVLRGTGGLEVFLMAETEEQLAQAAHDLVRRNFDGIAGADAPGLLLAPSLLLPADQPERLSALRSIRESMATLQPLANAEQAKTLDELAPWVAIDHPVTLDMLPKAVRVPLSERDGTFGRLGVMHLPMHGYDADVMAGLARHVAEWRERYPGVQFAAPSSMLGEVIPALRSDALTILALALAGLALASALLERSLRRTLLVLAPVGLAMTAACGAMVALGMHINLYNVLVLPVAFGVGVDGAVYIVWATADAPDLETFWKRYRVAGQAVLASSLTSLVAFGSISLAQNPGLASLGHLALLTFSLTLVANLVWLPCWLRWRGPEPAASPVHAQESALA